MIDVVNVRKSFRRGSQTVEALRGVSFHVERGRCAFIVGPSGSGKSTLLYMLGMLDRPDAGKISVEGQDLTALTEAQVNTYRREKVGFVFQSFNLIRNLSAVDNVLIPFLPVGITAQHRRQAEELLGVVGLGDRMHHRPWQMSGGEQQRVAIARALVKDPVLVLADEPTGELDSRIGDEIYRVLRRLQAQLNTTLVVVTHDRRFIRNEDLVLEIQDGRLISGGVSAANAKAAKGLAEHRVS